MDAEDLTAMVFLRMWEKGVVDLPWLYTVARNLLTDYYRKTKPVLVPQFYSKGEWPGFDERQRFYSITKAFLRLTAVQQQVVELRLLDYSYRDIGVILDRRAGSTKAVWHRATKRLQQRLGEENAKAVR